MDLFSTNVAYAYSLDTFIGNVDRLIINPIISLLFALAVAFFLWGVFEFLSGQDNDEKKSTGKSHMIWGLAGLVIMMGVFTIMNIILNTLNIKGINPQQGTVDLKDYNPPSRYNKK